VLACGHASGALVETVGGSASFTVSVAPGGQVAVVTLPGPAVTAPAAPAAPASLVSGSGLATSSAAPPSFLTDLAQSLQPSIATAPGAAPPSIALASFLDSSFELTLWNFVTTIRAFQNGQTLLTARGNMATIEYVLGGTATVVPLPAAGWLFVSGLALLGAVARRRRAAGSA
jgi:hypothetical protein